MRFASICYHFEHLNVTQTLNRVTVRSETMKQLNERSVAKQTIKVLMLILCLLCFNTTQLALAAPLPPLPVGLEPPQLTNPPVGEVPQTLAFSAQPTTDEICQARVFEEPLMTTGGEATQEENTALAAALLAFANRTNTDDFSALTAYLASASNQHWRCSLLFSLGLEYFNTGYYSKAIESWEEAWSLLQTESGGPSKRLADRTLSELLKMHSRIGDYDRLEELLRNTENRTLAGSSTEGVAGAKQALWLMQKRPGMAFRCGPLALKGICSVLKPKVDANQIVFAAESTQRGFSLAQLSILSQDLKLDYQMARRDPGAPLTVPSVVHWGVGHYAAILKQEDNRFLVVDPTFGQSRWVSQAALDAESSGYFLVSSGTLSNGWHSVSTNEGNAVWGKGVTGNSDPNSTTPYDTMSDPECDSRGMATYNTHLLLVSLHLEDTPLSFVPPRGPPIALTVTYNQREANQPANFTFSNFGHKWTCNWTSYITDNSTNANADVTYYVEGGGTEVFTYDTTNQCFKIQWRDQASLVRLSSSSYRMTFPDGSLRVFSQPDGTIGNSRKVFLTQVIDPTGYTNFVNYDSKLRLATVTDPQAGVTNLTFFYNSGQIVVDPYVVQKVTDRYGRSATFGYGTQHFQLETITDTLGITSQVAYASSFVKSLKTPYGTSTFDYGESGDVRWLETTDPQGEKTRVEFNQSDSIGIPNSDPGPKVPYGGGFYTRNYILFGRNTFYWDKKAMREAPGDYSKARIYHWLHNNNLASAVGALESYKEPLENRVWFNYSGQDGSYGATIYGTLNLPSVIGRVLDDGTSQFYQYRRNSLGKITNSVDPVGRSLSFIYSTNLIDLLEVRQTTGNNNQLLASYTYNTQHLPLTSKDASGQTTKYSYNAYGQVTGITNALSQVVSFAYGTTGNLLSITGPSNTVFCRFGYDSCDRVCAITNVDGFWKTIDYDVFDRLLTNTYPDGTHEVFTYNLLDPQAYIDRAGKVTQYTFDSLRQLRQITEATNWITRYDWCNCGGLSSITDPLGRTTEWLHDIQGRVTGKRFTDGSSVSYGYEQTTSRVKTFTNERGQARTYYWGYDDNLVGVVYADSSVTPSVIYYYDTNFNRLSATIDTTGTNVFEYYPIDSSPVIGAGRLKTVWFSTRYDTVTYRYDALGRTTNVVLSNSVYGSAHNANVYQAGYTFDGLGRLSILTAGDKNGAFFCGTYTNTYIGGSSRISRVNYLAGYMYTGYSYYGTNGDFRLQSITNAATPYLTISGTGTAGAQLTRFTYGYDPVGKITNITYQLGLKTITPTVNTYSYDAVGQLTNVTSTSNTTTKTYSYAYDLAGNRTMEVNNGNTWRSWYSPMNQLVGKDRGMTTNRSFVWDEENRLVRVTNGTFGAQIVYDSFGRKTRITEYTNGYQSYLHWYIWDGNRVIQDAHMNATNSMWCHWNYGPCVYDAYNSRVLVNTFDHLGSVREVIDSVGSLAVRYDYEPYGRQLTLYSNYFGGYLPGWGFCGLYSVPGYNLVFADNRAYDPDLGRWLSRDPIEEVGGLNLYEYCGNDPINKMDLDGLCAQQGFIGGPGQFRDPNTGQIRDGTGNAITDQLNPLNPLNFKGNRSFGIGEGEDAFWVVGRHGDMATPRPSGYQSHHGVNTVWAEANIRGYKADQAPAVLMRNDPYHNATRGVFNRFRSEIAASQGVSARDIDWSKVSPGTAWRLAEEQFHAAQTPLSIREEYFRQFNKYLDTLQQ
jgi:RHS repeat-associated protein